MGAHQDGQLTGLGTVQSLPNVAGCFEVSLQAEIANIRYTEDGTNPTATTGKILVVNNPEVCINGNIQSYKFYDSTNTARLNYSLNIDPTRK